MVRPINIVALHIDVRSGILYADEGLSDLTQAGFVISSGILIDGALVHSSLAELSTDDHPQYILVDGTRDFAANIGTIAALPTDPDHLTRKDYVDTEITNAVASGTAGVSFLNTLQGIITISGAGEVSVFEIGQAIVISGTPHPISNALIGSDGITVISGVSVDTIQGFRSEMVSVSGSLQDQLDTTVSGINEVFALRLDEVSSTITYIGEADPGSAEASNVWRIKQLEDLAPDLNITWASGIADFEFAWTDRLVLTYA